MFKVLTSLLILLIYSQDVDVDTVDYSVYHKRDCVSAVPKTPNSDLCGCNKLLSHPQHKYHLKDAKDWDYTKDTELHPTGQCTA